MSEHEPFVCAECERDEAIKERDEARKEVAALTERHQRLLTVVRGSFKKLRRLRDVWRDTENSVQALLLEMTQQRDEARKERDGWRVSEQETSRDYHEMRDLNTKVRSILGAPSDCSTDDAAQGVVRDRDRWRESTEKLTAERKSLVDERDTALRERDEAQGLVLARGKRIEQLEHDVERADDETKRIWARWEALASRLRSIDRVLMLDVHDAEVTLQAVQKVAGERHQAILDLEDLRRQWVEPREKARLENATARRCARSRVPLDGAEAQALEHALTITERERDDVRVERDQERNQAARIAQELERTKTLLDEQQRREAEQHKNWDKFAGEVLEALSAGPMEGMVEAARRVAVERDKLREQWVSPRALADTSGASIRERARTRVPLDGFEAEVLEVALTQTEGERDDARSQCDEACSQRDQARDQSSKLAEELERTKTLLAEDRAELRELRDRERDVELDPLLPSVLRWDRRETSSGLVFWEVLYESLIVGRVEQCRARGPLLGWWIWERLDGAREQGAEPDALKARGKLARHLRAHPPLAAAAPAEPEPDPDPKLPPGLRWVRVIFALGSYCWEVFDGAVAIARVEPSGPPNGCSDGWGWRWKFLGQPVPKRPTWGNTPDEYGARAVLARYLRAEATNAIGAGSNG